MRWSLLLVLAGCGRVGFDESARRPDAALAPIVGELDPTFGTGGIAMPSSAQEGDARDIELRGTGYLIIGTSFTPAAVAQMDIMAVAENGALDTAYGAGGEVFLEAPDGAFGYGLAMLPDGGAIVMGDGVFPGEADNFVLGKLTAAGSLDPGWGGGAFVSFNIPPTTGGDTAWNAVTVGATTYVCGIADYEGDSRFTLLATRADGSLDTSFAAGGIASTNFTAGRDECRDIAYDGTALVVAGRIGGALSLGTYSLDGNSTAGTTVMQGRGNGLAIQPDGARVVAGETPTGGTIVRFVGTTLDPSFGNGGVVDLPGDTLTAVQIDRQGRIVVAGVRGAATPVIRRFLADGSPDPDFADAGAFTLAVDGRFLALALDLLGRIVAVGSTDTGLDHPLVVRLH